MPQTRKPAPLRQSTHRALTRYALAASAAGVGALALAQPAAAEIVYTRAHQNIRPRDMFGLDLNHDGKVDFALDNIFHGSRGSNFYLHWRVQVQPAVGGAIASSGPYHYGAALKKGAVIGPDSPWQPKMELLEAEAAEFGYYFTYGNWNDVSNTYLGLRFQIDGEDHYGWARLSIHWAGDQLVAELTGYAYESEANTAIIAGDTGGTNAADQDPDAASQVAITPRPAQFAVLGALSLGAEGLAVWRRP